MVKQKFCVVSDGSCDVPEKTALEYGVDVVHFLVSFDGVDYKREGVELSLPELYRRMVEERDVFPKTAAPPPEDFYEVFEKHAGRGEDILCVCISTKLSGSLQSAQIAAQMIKEQYPGIRVAAVDSLCCTLMQAAYVLEACRKYTGRSMLSPCSASGQQLESTRGRILSATA